MDMIKLEVGELFDPEKTKFTEKPVYTFKSGGHQLCLFMNSISGTELKAVKKSRVEFAMFSVEGIIFFLYRFSNFKNSGHFEIVVSGDTLYNWHRIPENEKIVKPFVPETENQRAGIDIILVEATTGIIKNMRFCTFSYEFTKILHWSILAQIDKPGISEEKALKIYNTHNHFELWDMALITCSGDD